MVLVSGTADGYISGGGQPPGLFVNVPSITPTVYTAPLARARASERWISVLPNWLAVGRLPGLARLGRPPERGACRPRRALLFLAGLAR